MIVVSYILDNPISTLQPVNNKLFNTYNGSTSIAPKMLLANGTVCPNFRKRLCEADKFELYRGRKWWDLLDDLYMLTSNIRRSLKENDDSSAYHIRSVLIRKKAKGRSAVEITLDEA